MSGVHEVSVRTILKYGLSDILTKKRFTLRFVILLIRALIPMPIEPLPVGPGAGVTWGDRGQVHAYWNL